METEFLTKDYYDFILNKILQFKTVRTDMVHIHACDHFVI